MSKPRNQLYLCGEFGLYDHGTGSPPALRTVWDVDTIRIMTDRDTGRARGFGFIEMPNRHTAQDAIAGLNGTCGSQ